MKRRFKEKSTFAELIIKEDIQYPLLYYADSLYPEKLTLLRSTEFKAAIRKAARQLNPLLSLKTDQFFQLLEKNLSIRTSLESCLATFPRRQYSRYVDTRQNQINSNHFKDFKDESYIIYSFLMKIVLFIYYRISSATDVRDRELAYNQFLVDIPKLLDIAAVYGESNPQIVKKLIANAYQLHPSYDNDTMDFFNFVECGKLQEMERNKSTFIDFSPQSLSAENYGNRQKYMMEKTMLTMFTVKDILFNLNNFILYFPKNYVYELASDYKLQQKLVDGVTFFMNQMDNQWNMGAYKQRYFALHFEDLRQSMARYFISLFKILKEIIIRPPKQAEEFLQSAHNTYETFCLLFKTNNRSYHLQYVKLINLLIEQSDEIIFFLNGSKVLNSVNKTIVAVEYCQRYEKEYRSKHRLGGSIDFDPILNKNRDNLKKFKQIYINPSGRKRQRIAKERQQKSKRIEDYQLNSYISNLKYGGKSKEYDDQPQQQQFNRVQLPNDHGKVQKNQLNLSFKIVPKKYYVLKKQLQYKDLNLSFKFANKKDDFSSLSFNQTKGIPNTQDTQLSIVMAKNHPQGLEDLDISKIENNLDFDERFTPQQNHSSIEFDKFCWDDDQSSLINEFQQLLQVVSSKKNVRLDDLSYV